LTVIPRSRGWLEQAYYDLRYPNPAVEHRAELDEMLQAFPRLARSKVPLDFKERVGITEPRYQTLSAKRFYHITKRDLYRRVVGRIRIKDLFPVDQKVRKLTIFSKQPLYWGIDPRILYKVLELRDILTQKGLNPDGFRINTGYRHPVYNRAVGGASKSRHIAGDAVDLLAKDIDGNGKSEQEDKELLLHICEQELIGKQGGVGRYPGTMVVHIDLRGYAARWDSY